jgi:hypothetical protein
LIAKAVHEDQDYAWTWLCNLAMMAQDAGATNAEANKRAANFLYNIFGISFCSLSFVVASCHLS